MKNKRSIYIGITLISFIACIIIVKSFSTNLFIRGFLGDVFATLLMYYLLKAFKPLDPKKNFIIVLALCYMIEILQGFHFIDLIGLGHIPIVRTVFGAVFDIWDLVAYTFGAIIAVGIDIVLLNKSEE